jgi:hypothetical protein
MASLAVNRAYSNSNLRISPEYKGLSKGRFSGGGGGGGGFGAGRRLRARINLITRILTIKKPKELATLLILNMIALSA